MASLKDVSEVVTEELEQRIRRLHEGIVEGGGDLAQLVALADEVAEFADSMASTFAAIDEELGRRVAEARAVAAGGAEKRRRRGGQRRAASAIRGEAADEPTRAELLEQAQEADIAGRSSMSKEELAEAVESQEHLTKEELLEQAKAAGIPGRSQMSKEELIEAIRKEASASREELLERAKEADIPGRADMSKEELRQALRSL